MQKNGAEDVRAGFGNDGWLLHYQVAEVREVHYV